MFVLFCFVLFCFCIALVLLTIFSSVCVSQSVNRWFGLLNARALLLIQYLCL